MQVTIVVLVTRSSGQCNSGLRSSVLIEAHATAIVADGNSLQDSRKVPEGESTPASSLDEGETVEDSYGPSERGVLTQRQRNAARAKELERSCR